MPVVARKPRKQAPKTVGRARLKKNSVLSALRSLRIGESWSAVMRPEKKEQKKKKQ